MQQLSDCFQEAVSLKISVSYNKRYAPHVLGLVFKRSSSQLRFLLEKMKRDLRSQRIEIFIYEFKGYVGISLLCKEENITIKTNRLNYDSLLMEKFRRSADNNEKLVLAFYGLTKDNRMRMLQDRNGDPVFIPVYLSTPPHAIIETDYRNVVEAGAADELCSFIFDYDKWKN